MGHLWGHRCRTGLQFCASNFSSSVPRLASVALFGEEPILRLARLRL